MLAFRLIWTALLQVFSNFGQTLRIFLLPSLIFVGTLAALLPYVGSYAHPVGSKLAIMALCAILFGCLFWVAVNFHRMILSAENVAWVPRFHGREVLAYTLYFIPILIIFAVISFATTWLAGLIVFEAVKATQDITTVIINYHIITTTAYLMTTAIGLRLSAQLPAVAIGEPATSVFPGHKRSWLTLLAIALILRAAQFVYELLATAIAERFIMPLSPDTVPEAASWLPFAFFFAASLASVVFSISLITTLYGYYAKGMPLR